MGVAVVVKLLARKDVDVHLSAGDVRALSEVVTCEELPSNVSSQREISSLLLRLIK